jgi:fructose-1,6-bisphosphatase/inositol monophosphatase family enzyme
LWSYAGYREKIWDQAPAVHFVKEAGGEVTDQKGNQLNFDLGSDSGGGALMSPNIEEIITSCGGKFHTLLLQALKEAKSKEPYENS